MSFSLYIEQLREVVRATHIHSPTVFSWFGKQSPRLRRAVERDLTPRSARSYLIYNLQARLYSSFYCEGAAGPTASGSQNMLGEAAFVERLAEANGGSGFYESGWEVTALEGAMVEAMKDGLRLRAGIDSLTATTVFTQGEQASLRFGKDNRAISAGFYMAMGDRELPFATGSRLVRLYWNITPEGAIVLMRGMTGALNGAGMPFRLKVVNDPTGFDRCDSAVLYVQQADYIAVVEIVSRLYSELWQHLRRNVPALTKPLAHGLGLAEEPGNGDSFGLNRCRLVAEGLVRAHEASLHTVEERLERVVDCFTETGISLHAPFLAPGSKDSYTLSLPGAKLHGPSEAMPAVGEPASRVDFLATSHSIGVQLAQDAIWYGGSCNWIGAETEKQGGRSIYSALGPDLYTGTAGVALFLGELCRLSGGGDLRRTALGAMRQALAHVDNMPAGEHCGFYTGWMGVAVASARVGLATGSEELMEAGRKLWRRCAEGQPCLQHDLLGGKAGTIVGCLLLESMTGDDSLRIMATGAADRLIAAANRRRSGLSWGRPGARLRRDLTGLSHGAAGIGYALLELWAASGEAAYRQAAESAFEYERAWFSAEVGNWPDFREAVAGTHAGAGKSAFATFWCHGAPGIALSRLRAWGLLGDKVYRNEALAGLRTTARSVEAEVGSGHGNYSLCHGISGNAQALLHGAVSLGEQGKSFEKIAYSAAMEGIERYGVHGEWPCGVGREQAPGLMLGLAGIGHAYLRLYDCSVPSVLLLRREDWAPS